MASQPQSLDSALRRVRELERELAALRASIGTRETDTAYICDQLREDIARATRVRAWREPHSFGSSVARENLAEVVLPTEVTIDADDVETLPRRVRLRLAKEGAELRVTARLRADDGERVVYAVEESE
jgi:ribosomal protein L29